jgi:hypothetical protein
MLEYRDKMPIPYLNNYPLKEGCADFYKLVGVATSHEQSALIFKGHALC